MYSGLSTSCPRLTFLSLRCSPWQPAGVLPAVHHHPLTHAKGQCQVGSSWQGPGRHSHSQSVDTAIPSTHLPSQWEPPINRNLCLVDEVKIEKRNPAFPDTGRVWSEGHMYTHVCTGFGIRPRANSPLALTLRQAVAATALRAVCGVCATQGRRSEAELTVLAGRAGSPELTDVHEA